MIVQQVSESSLISLFVIAVCVVAAPLLSALSRKRVPDVVWLLVLAALVPARLASVLPSLTRGIVRGTNSPSQTMVRVVSC